MATVEFFKRKIKKNSDGMLELDLRSSGLRGFPEEITQLTEIEVLDLSNLHYMNHQEELKNNSIRRLPESFSNLAHLKKLRMCDGD